MARKKATTTTTQQDKKKAATAATKRGQARRTDTAQGKRKSATVAASKRGQVPSTEAGGSDAPEQLPLARAVSAAPTVQEIATRAYHIFLAEGRPRGQDVDHWLRAERALRAERGGLKSGKRTSSAGR